MSLFSRKRALVIGSLAAHGALAFVLVPSGVCKLERLDPDRRTIGLAVTEPPAASGSPLGAQVTPKMTPKVKKTIVKELRQLEVVPPAESLAPTIDSTETGNGLGSGSGSGSNPDGDDDSTGTCVGPACGPAVPTPTPKPVPVVEEPPLPTVVAPTVLKALRVSGDTNVVPSDVVKTRMLRDGNTRSTGVFKVCIGATGSIESVSQAGSTRYAEYDATLASAIRGWRYRPYLVGGRGVSACGMVTLMYTIK